MERKILEILGFTPKENTSGIFYKKYNSVDNYTIEVDFDNKYINYGNLIQTESKTTSNFSQPENFVVLECVNRLLEKGYHPKNITLEKTWAAGHGTSGRLDICVNREDGSEYLLIECKTFGKEFDKEFNNMKKNGGQLFTYFKFSNKPDIIMLYASDFKNNQIIYQNEIIKIEEEYRIGDVKDFYDKWNKLTKDNGVFENWVKPYNFESKALTIDDLCEIKPEDSSFIFNRFLEILRHNVVSDKPNAFNKIFTLFLCKIYDEKQHEDGEKKKDELDFQWKETDDDVSFQLRLTDLYKNGMKEFLEKKVTDFSEDEFLKKYAWMDESVKNNILEDFKKIRLEKNNEFAIKEVYDNRSFKENAVVVKHVVELLQKYRIRYAKKQQYLSDFFELLLTTGLKQESGQFFTPVPIAQFIIKSLPIDDFVKNKLKKGDRGDLLPHIIDFAAGSGHFITESMNTVQYLINSIDERSLNSDAKKLLKIAKEIPFDWALEYIYGIEKDYRLVKVGKVGCYLHGDGLANVVHSDGLANFQHVDFKGKLRETDKNFPRENKQFDIVISNPPYSVSAFKNASKEYYGKDDFELYEKLTNNSSEIECLFIERTKQLLKDGGVAGIILPSSILSNSGVYTTAREMILKYFEIIAITELGSNTFMATGTNTVVLFLKRKNNYDSVNIKISVDKFFTNLQDVTINGIEKPVSKYIGHVWEGITFADYISLAQKNPNQTVEKREIYKEYNKKINGKNEEDKWNKIIELEKEKLFYFIIAYPQKLVLVKSGDKDEEKKFLGYEFSNRRGSEGIHPIQRGKSIDECTKLYDTDSFTNPEKASAYIYKAFTGDFNSEIDESLKNNITRLNLIDTLSFDRVDFEKTISLNVKKKVKLESKWEIVKIGDICETSSGGTPLSGTPEYYENGNILWINSGEVRQGVILDSENRITALGLQKSSAKIFPKDTVLLAMYGATAGQVGILGIEASTNQAICGILPSPQILPMYLFYFLKTQYKNILALRCGVARLNISQEIIKTIKIPLPPKEIQEKIVSEIEVLEEKEKKVNEKIIIFNNSLKNLMNDNSSEKYEKLENIALLIKRGKSVKYGMSNIQIIKSGQARGYKKFDFSSKHFVDNSFIIDERLLQKGDILINSTGVGTAGRVTLFNLDGQFVVDSHITILRPNIEKTLPEFVLYSLANIGFKKIENMAMGQSGQIELSISTIQNIKIPLPSLAEQKEIVSKIEEIETSITKLEKELEKIPEEKELILKKYLL